jgi:hypothetical protein
MTEEHYLTEDSILPQLHLDDPCEIRVDITENRVDLHIGPRDFGWTRGCPDLADAGTMMPEGVIDEHPEGPQS